MNSVHSNYSSEYVKMLMSDQDPDSYYFDLPDLKGSEVAVPGNRVRSKEELDQLSAQLFQTLQTNPPTMESCFKLNCLVAEGANLNQTVGPDLVPLFIDVLHNNLRFTPFLLSYGTDPKPSFLWILDILEEPFSEEYYDIYLTGLNRLVLLNLDPSLVNKKGHTFFEVMEILFAKQGSYFTLESVRNYLANMCKETLAVRHDPEKSLEFLFEKITTSPNSSTLELYLRTLQLFLQENKVDQRTLNSQRKTLISCILDLSNDSKTPKNIWGLLDKLYRSLVTRDGNPACEYLIEKLVNPPEGKRGFYLNKLHHAILLSNNANLRFVNSDGKTLMHYIGWPFNASDPSENSMQAVLHSRMMDQDPDFVFEYYLEQMIEATDSSRFASLERFTNLILFNNASPQAKNSAGKTIVDYVFDLQNTSGLSKQNAELLKMLLSRIVDANPDLVFQCCVERLENSPPEQLSFCLNTLDMVLFSEDPDPTYVNAHGRTAENCLLSLQAQEGISRNAQTLIENQITRLQNKNSQAVFERLMGNLANTEKSLLGFHLEKIERLFRRADRPDPSFANSSNETILSYILPYMETNKTKDPLHLLSKSIYQSVAATHPNYVFGWFLKHLEDSNPQVEYICLNYITGLLRGSNKLQLSVANPDGKSLMDYLLDYRKTGILDVELQKAIGSTHQALIKTNPKHVFKYYLEKLETLPMEELPFYLGSLLMFFHQSGTFRPQLKNSHGKTLLDYILLDPRFRKLSLDHEDLITSLYIYAVEADLKYAFEYHIEKLQGLPPKKFFLFLDNIKQFLALENPPDKFFVNSHGKTLKDYLCSFQQNDDVNEETQSLIRELLEL